MMKKEKKKLQNNEKENTKKWNESWWALPACGGHKIMGEEKRKRKNINENTEE